MLEYKADLNKRIIFICIAMCSLVMSLCLCDLPVMSLSISYNTGKSTLPDIYTQAQGRAVLKGECRQSMSKHVITTVQLKVMSYLLTNFR